MTRLLVKTKQRTVTRIIVKSSRGPQGRAATVTVGTTTTLPEGSQAAVQNTGTAVDAILNFGIPKGDKGEQGDPATNLVTSVAGKQGVVTLDKSDVGLSNVDNTSDINKPISNATQTALNTKATVTTLDAHANNTENPHQVTKAQVGLGNVDNTSDVNKPISTATQSALDTKATTTALNAHTNNTTNPHNVTKAQVGLGNVDNTSDASKPVSTAQQTELDKKVDKEAGKALSTNDYTTLEKSKLAGIATGAEVNVQSDWNASSGDAHILNKPTLGTAAATAATDYATAAQGAKADTAVQPATLTAHTSNTSNPHSVTKAQVGLGNVQNLAPADMPVSTAQQTALNAKANASDTVNLTGNQTVAGVKTFSSSPVVPTATTGTQAVNKAQMDALTVPKSIVDAKGDLLVGTANDTIARKAVGPDGALLMADSNDASGVVWQSPSPLLVNLLTNSDFSNGTTGWSTFGSGTTIANSSGSLVVTATVGVNTAIGATSITPTPIVGNKYYAAVDITPFRTHTFLFRFGSVTALGPPVTANVKSRPSVIITASSVSESGLIVYINGSVNTGQVDGSNSVFDNAILINLTACFGAGKEPSLSEMDAIMERWTNSWFAKETPQLLPSYDWLKLTQNAATNLVTNGDFSNGTTGWGSGGSSLSATSGVLAITGDGSVPVPTAQVIPSQTFIAGEKWYAAVSIRVTNSSVTTMRARFIAGYLDINQASPVSGTWYTQSGTFTVISTITAALAAFSATYPDAATASGKVQEVKNVLAINLTKTFGAGNEPTKSEMDYLLSKYPNSWFNGTVNDLVTRYDSRRRIGTGSPEGVVTAPVGTEWTDTLNTNGALVWRKATGTGNTGWQVLEGDTGWRNITSSLVNGWVAGEVLIKRINSQVYIRVENLQASSMTVIDVLTAPNGFKAFSTALVTSSERQFLTTATNPAAVWRATTPSNGIISIQGATTALGALYGTLQYSTSQNWPTSLPGVSA